MAAKGDTASIILDAPGVQSLAWVADDLVDHVGGGTRFRLDGTVEQSRVYFAFPFDASVVSPSGDVAVIYQRTGTKGVVLHNGSLVRELNRSYYCADVYEYPICVFERDGQTLLAHCPDRYNRIEIEDALTGQPLTARPTNDEASDFFHSRLAVDATGQYLVSAGWVWHPWDAVTFFDIDACLSDSTGLDSLSGSTAESGHVGLCEEASACWLGSGLLLITANSDTHDGDDDEQPDLLPNGYVVYDIAKQAVVGSGQLDAPAGLVMAVGDGRFVAFYDHPRLVRIADGSVLHEWPALATGSQLSSIVHQAEIPIVATDPRNNRFAVKQDDQIHVVSIPGAAE